MVVEHLVGREVLDPDDQALAQGAEVRRQAGIGLGGQRLEYRRARVPSPAPGQRIVEWAGHAGLLGEVRRIAKRLTKQPK